MRYIILCMLYACFSNAQDNFEKTYEASSIQHVVIDNFSGDITVLKGNTAQVRITAKNTNANASDKIELRELIQGDVVALYIHHPCKEKIGTFDPQEPFEFLRTEQNCSWGGEETLFPTYEFILEVPASMNVYVSTVMDGEVKIDNIEGMVYASNVNGSIAMKNVANVMNGTTVNGDIDIDFTKKPGTDGKFTTINGEINLNVPERTALTTRFKSFMGELYTDLPDVEYEASKVHKGSVSSGEVVKIEEFSEAKIGGGGVVMTIETFNGNAYLKKNK